MLASNNSRLSLLVHDVSLIGIMAVLAACGLVYEYLLSYYTARVLGSVETVIYAMIGVMIVAMGAGSFSAKLFKHPFTAFAWLEIIIAALGCSSILVIAATQAFSSLYPRLIAEVFLLPEELIPQGGFINQVGLWFDYFPYLMGFILGFFIGMEIPLIARVREQIYGRHLQHNAGTIYGADYVGAGVGAAIWVLVMLNLQMTTAAALTALANVLAGGVFVWRYFNEIKLRYLIVVCHGVVFGFIVLIASFGESWLERLTDTLYLDHVVHSETTTYQHFAVTERITPGLEEPTYNFYINGRLQFSSNDEYIYHDMLVAPAMLAAGRKESILIIGGGDGLALRDVLRWNPKHVTLIDLDEKLLNFFIAPEMDKSVPSYQHYFHQLNQNSFSDHRVEVVSADAFIEIDRLIREQRKFDVIIVDLPDPSHPDLNKLYSRNFYFRLNQLLMGDGVLVAQSTSPFHARKAFISIGKTIAAAGFSHLEQYHQNVPSFGEWGWSIATKTGQSASARIELEYSSLPGDSKWITKELILASFQFPRNFYKDRNSIEVNRLGSHVTYQYHQKAWNNYQGLLDIPDH